MLLTFKPFFSLVDEEKAHILLVSRVASLLPIHQGPVGFSGPLSRNLLSFNSFVTKYTTNARQLLEMVLFSLLANNDANKLGELRWDTLGVSLPFQHNTNSGLGIAVKTYLDELCGKENPTDSKQREEKKSELKTLFAHSTDIVSDFEKALRLWDAVVVAVKSAVNEGAFSASEAEAFEDADAWLRERR